MAHIKNYIHPWTNQSTPKITSAKIFSRKFTYKSTKRTMNKPNLRIVNKNVNITSKLDSLKSKNHPLNITILTKNDSTYMPFVSKIYKDILKEFLEHNNLWN